MYSIVFYGHFDGSENECVLLLLFFLRLVASVAFPGSFVVRVPRVKRFLFCFSFSFFTSFLSVLFVS